MVILWLFLALVLIMVTVYLLGLLPGTGPYAVRKYKLNAVKGIEKKSIQAKCRAVKKIKNDDFKKGDRFFTFSGFKTIEDLTPYPDVVTLYDTCMDLDRGDVMEEDAFKEMLRSSGIEAAAVKWKGGAPCDEAIQGASWDHSIKGVVRADHKIVSPDVYMENTNPDVYDFIFTC